MRFVVMRPSGREVWDSEDWRAAAIAADWLRRQKRVARDHGRAVAQVYAAEFEAAWAQRMADGEARRKAG